MNKLFINEFKGIEVGEIKTVIDEAETQNIAMNSIYILKLQEAIYRMYSCFSGDKQPTFMNVLEYNERPSESMMTERRPDLLNRIENFLISMSHSFDQHVDEQLKQMRELKEQVVIIMQQLDVVKKKLLVANNIATTTQATVINNSNSFNNNMSSLSVVRGDFRNASMKSERRLSRLIEIAVAEFEEENKNKSRNAADEETTTTNNQIKSGITRNTTF